MARAPRILVLGAGPAGLGAALAAEALGADVTLVDALPEPGGQIWRGLWRKDAPGKAGAHFHALRTSGVVLRMGCRIVTAPGPGSLGLIGPHGPEVLSYDRLVLASGARERFLPFPGWTLPGVLGAGALQGLVKGGLEVRGKRVVVAGSGPLLLAVASHLRSQGARVLTVAEQAPNRALVSLIPGLLARPKLLLQALPFLSLPTQAGAWVTRAEGEGRLERVHLNTPKGARVLEADLLACGFGLVPNLDLARLLGCAIHEGAVAVDELQRTSVAGVFAAGESTGIGGVDKALTEGHLAGLAATGLEDEARRHIPAAARSRAWGRALEAAHALRPELRGLATPETMLCRCEDVSVGALQSFARGRDARLHARCGMGRCQGRTCGPAAEFLFGWAPGGPNQPLVPTTFADLVGALSPTEQP
ncbi:oxidoreductase [Geothrix limicola]|uniref:Oxidoreductase n=1 Tax=Geothrix limicola TaxID=2927978 RepID=A0ABQ5QB84_9BACT|nr:FAD/NAD(P)-binding oxidoreductase [Geothrix limicola]GLH71715.1 oxidoreductase [Geothrix limicola]